MPKRLDVRGKSCPIPVLEVAKAIKEVEVGDVLEVYATDPAADPDIRAWAKRMGHEVVASEKLPDGSLHIIIKRCR